jgi:hypothetical protein
VKREPFFWATVSCGLIILAFILLPLIELMTEFRGSTAPIDGGLQIEMARLPSENHGHVAIRPEEIAVEVFLSFKSTTAHTF